MDALIFDVGEVLLVPHADPLADVLGFPLSAAQAEEAHYHGIQALDASEGGAAERYAYLEGYARCAGVGESDLAEVIPRMQALFSASNLVLWRQPVRGSVEALRALAGGPRKL